MAAELEIQCECARCGNKIATREILNENRTAVAKSDDAKARG